MIPLIAAAATAIPGIIKGISNLSAAGKQAARAGSLRGQAGRVKKAPLRPEFAAALRSADMMATQGLQGKDLINQEIEDGTANNLRAIRESSGSGAGVSGAIAASLGAQNRAQRQVQIADAQARQAGAMNANNELKFVGGQQRELEKQAINERNALNMEASQLENASTANKQQAVEGIAGSLTGALGQAGGLADNAIGIAAGKNALAGTGASAEDVSQYGKNQWSQVLGQDGFGYNNAAKPTGGIAGGIAAASGIGKAASGATPTTPQIDISALQQGYNSANPSGAASVTVSDYLFNSPEMIAAYPNPARRKAAALQIEQTGQIQ